jgi:hypothetical protein
MLCCIGEQSHKAGLLDCSAQTTLMLRAGARLTAGLDLAAIRNVSLHEAASIFVVNLTYVVMTKRTNFAARRALTAVATLTAWSRCFLHSLSPSM